jgi:3-hydroxyacyl-[acyl-carrier-protein] dehydratase
VKLGPEEIKNFLPHRDPFLFLDEVAILSYHTLTGVFTPKKDMLILQGHFPGNPVIPGVVLIESLAQLACFIGYGQKDLMNFYLVGVDGFKFKKIVRPEATLTLKVTLENSRLSLFHFAGTIYCNEEKICEGKLWGTIAKREL